MASSIEAFRSLLYKEVSLPSGLVAQIRKVQQWDLIGGEELPMPRGGTGEERGAPTGEQVRYLKLVTDRIIVKGTVSPPLTDLRDDGGEPVYLPDKLHISELTEPDYVALAVAIRGWCGLTQEDGQAIESFRSDPECAPGESVGGAVPLLAQ